MSVTFNLLHSKEQENVDWKKHEATTTVLILHFCLGTVGVLAILSSIPFPWLELNFVVKLLFDSVTS